MRQAKLGISFRVKVPVGQGLTSHPYRVLRIWRRKSTTTEQDVRSVHRESCGPQGRPHSPKRFSLVTPIERVATVLAFRKPIQRDRIGEIHEGLPGSESVARRKRDARNLGDPAVSLLRVGWTNPKEGHLMGSGESDRSIVL